MLFYTGNLYALNVKRTSFKELYSQTWPLWNREIEEQQSLIKQAKENTQKRLDILAVRLGQLQANVMRLDALGSRLATMADLKDIEFNIDRVPGMGGPHSTKLHGTIQVGDFLKNMEKLMYKIQDREQKLVAMESVLINKTLRSETLPTGKPTKDGWISSLFGMRTSPISGKMEFHQGVDYAGRANSPILAVGAGIVTWSGQRYGYGNLVEINHGNGYLTRYAHNKRNLVIVGEKVNKGQQIALMGSTGRSTGPHIHFEVVHNGKTVNPKKYISLK